MTETVITPGIEQITATPDLVPETPKERHVIRPHENHHFEPFFKHMVWAEVTGQDLVDTARVRKMHVVALCGYTWVPSVNPVDVKATCDTCMDMMYVIMKNEGDA